MRDSADSSFLLGLLAWQNGLITWADLSAAVGSCQEADGANLGKFLVKSGALSQRQLDQLEPLVEAHLEIHGNDPKRALESLGSQLSGSATELLKTLKQNARPGGSMHRSVDLTTLASMAAAQQTNSQALASGARTRDLRSDGRRFRILKPHAKGGLGEVFVARDDALNRNVAVKEIQGRFSDNHQSRERFLLEAEVTGGLEHPGIVPVYALGQYDDGRPYYAMRFIKGDSLKEAISDFHNDTSGDATSQRLRLRELLGRFVDVCQSISYAHSRGVLHRDLKPGNIMLGKYGETLVVDWGLARVLEDARTSDDVVSDDDASLEDRLQPISGSGATPTALGSAIGTPAYMPPEQAAGDVDAMSPASDVYSLGATLYHVLTGKPPFQADNVAQILSNVQSGEFQSPASLSASIPKTLDAICSKAMALGPADRYESPLGLAQDVERYLADEPVSAFVDPWHARLRRWARKHQTVTVATASCLLLAVVGLAVFSGVVGQKNTELVQLNEQLDSKNVLLAESNTNEMLARKKAEANALIAQRQSELALSTLTGVIADLQYGLATVSGSGPVRKRLLETSISKLKEISTSFVQQASVDYETAEAFLEMGRLVQQIVAENSEGDSVAESAIETAEIFLQRSQSIADQLKDAYPDNTQVQSLMSRACLATGQLMAAKGDPRGAISYLEKGIEAGHLSIAGGIGRPFDLSVFHDSVAAARLSLGELPAAYDSYLQSATAIENAIEKGAASESDLVYVLGRIAAVLQRQGKLTEAVDRLELAVQAARASATETPDELWRKVGLAQTLGLLADAVRSGGDDGRAMLLLSEALTLARELIHDAPSNTIHVDLLATTLDRMGDIYLSTDQAESAIPLFEEALRLWSKLKQGAPESVPYRAAIASSMLRLGDAMAQVGDVEGTRQRYQALLDTYKPLSEDAPDDVDAQRGLATAYERMAMLHEYEGQHTLAEEEYRQMLAIKQKLHDSSPADMLALHELAITHRHLGDILELQGKPDAALAEFKAVAELAQQLVVQDPNKAVNRIEIGNAHARAGDTQSVMRRFDDAAASYSKAAEVFRQMIRDQLSSATAESRLVGIEESLYAARNGELATGPLDPILQKAREEQSKLLLVRGMIAVRSRDWEAIRSTARAFRELESPSADDLYSAAALLAMICELDPKVEDGEQLLFSKQAIELLERSVAAGLEDPDKIQFDTDLRFLWDFPEFQEIVDRVSR